MKLKRNVIRSDKNAPRADRKTKRIATWCRICGRKHSKDDPCEFPSRKAA